MHLVLSAEASESFLEAELHRQWPGGDWKQLAPRLWQVDAPLCPEAPPRLVFARQAWLEASAVAATSISQWSQLLLDRLRAAGLDGDEPWLLQIDPHYGTETAGLNRCKLIAEALRERMRRQHRSLLRAWRPDPAPFEPGHSLVQLLLTSPESGFMAVSRAPWPHQFRTLVSPFPKGEVPVAVGKAAPSRAFAKLVEAELRLGRRMGRDETCVDLGAAPGSWTYVALQRGARVTAVDRAPLRDDLMRHPFLVFHRGDAFKFEPATPVDWLICDVIAAPERSMGLVVDWVRRGWARHFVVTIKFKGHDEYGSLESLKHAMPPLCSEFYLSRLSANKNEACAFGTRRNALPPAPFGANPSS